jgi:hypothetical protein
MCGCTGSSKSVCGGDKDKLRQLRNRVVTLHNTTKDPIKKAEYKEVLEGINEVSKSSACPDKAFLRELKIYVDSEYSKLRK